MTDWTAEEDLLGFFGPDSVTWRIHSDPTFSVGGLRALLLQALHPVAMDGVARFSGGFRDEPWPRLIRTATYVDTLTFGTRTEAQAAVDRVRGIHRRLGATEATTGPDVPGGRPGPAAVGALLRGRLAAVGGPPRRVCRCPTTTPTGTSPSR